MVVDGALDRRPLQHRAEAGDRHRRERRRGHLLRERLDRRQRRVGGDARPVEVGRGQDGPVVGAVRVVRDAGQAGARRVRRHLRERVVDDVRERLVGRDDHVVALGALDRVPGEHGHVGAGGAGLRQQVVGRAQVAVRARLARAAGRIAGEGEGRAAAVADVRPRAVHRVVARVLAAVGLDAHAPGAAQGGQVGGQVGLALRHRVADGVVRSRRAASTRS